MKSICIIAYTDYLTDARVMRQAESASQFGYAVDVITPRNRGQERRLVSNGVTVRRLGAGQYRGIRKIAYLLSYSDFFVRCFVRVTRLHAVKGYQVVQVCNMPDFLVFTAVYAKLTGARIVLDIHDPMPRTYLAKFPDAGRRGLYRMILWQERLSAGFADRVLTVHEPIKRDILISDGIPEGKISVIANFPDDDIFQVHGPYVMSSPLRLIYYGTVSARFGFEIVLEAISGVRHRDRLFFKIIGKGDEEVSLRRRIAALGLASIVDFENTAYPLRRLPEIVRGYHLGLAPYAPTAATDYILPVKLMELLAMGIPAITVPNTAIRHYLDDGLYFAYDPGDAKTLTDLLDRILENPSLVIDKRDAVLGQSQSFLWKNERSKYLDILAQLIQ